MPPKTEVTYSGTWFAHSMPAIVSDVGAGLKWVSYNPTNRSKGLPNSSALLILNDRDSGLPYCMIDSMWATYARTAACAIVAIRALAIPHFSSIALVGAGQMAHYLVPAFDQAFPHVERFEVATRSERSARLFCDAVRPHVRAEIAPAANVHEAVVRANVIVTATGAREPPLGVDDLHPGALAVPLDAEHSWTTAAFRRADKVFSDDAAVLRKGFRDRRPSDSAPGITGELHEVVGGLIPGRLERSDRIICSNNGIAILDIVLGTEIAKRAFAERVGVDFELDDGQLPTQTCPSEG